MKAKQTKIGRPATVDDGVRITVYLDADLLAITKKLRRGGESRSNTIRRLLRIGAIVEHLERRADVARREQKRRFKKECAKG